jgi:hypothetical protein
MVALRSALLVFLHDAAALADVNAANAGSRYVGLRAATWAGRRDRPPT